MKTIKLLQIVGEFAENKDLAKMIREDQILPNLLEGKKVILNFAGVSSATQSFIHALISDLIRKYDADLFDTLIFKNCSDTVKEIINIVVDYMLERN